MVSKCIYVGVKNSVQSKKDGKVYDVHCVDNGRFILEILTEAGACKYNKGDTVYVDSYKAKDGKWKNRVIDL